MPGGAGRSGIVAAPQADSDGTDPAPRDGTEVPWESWVQPSGQGALRGGDARLARVDGDRGPQRPGERLEAGLDHVVRVGARLEVEVQRQPRGRGDGAEELLRRLVLEAGDVAGREALEALAGAVGAPRDVDPAGGARLVHRDHGVPVAGDPAAVAER